MIYNKLVLNLRAGDNAVSFIKPNPPYDLMVDLEKISPGWGGGTRTPACQDQNLVPYQLGYTPLCELINMFIYKHKQTHINHFSKNITKLLGFI